jgi:hypothetical protein
MGDILLMQNETAHQAAMAQAAQARGMEVVYSAAPFDLGAVQAVLPFVNMLVMNAVEAGQLQAAMAVDLHDLPVETVVVTRGGDGASWHARGWPDVVVPALPTKVVDTTGAGDCFHWVRWPPHWMGARGQRRRCALPPPPPAFRCRVRAPLVRCPIWPRLRRVYSNLFCKRCGIAHYATPIRNRFRMANFAAKIGMSSSILRRRRSSSKPVRNHDFEQ